jgi:hypothetical protein
MAMRKTIGVTALLALLLLAAGAASVQAQTAVKGAIRGAVYQDANADGICGAGDPAMAGVRIDFTPQGGQTVSLVTFSDGTYGLASINLGAWQVTARPPEGWVTTSLQTIAVGLTPEQNTADNVNFCLAQSSTPGGDKPNTLPDSGAFAPPALLVAAALSILLMLAGVGLMIFARRVLARD